MTERRCERAPTGERPRAEDEELPAFDHSEQVVAAIDSVLARKLAPRAGEKLRTLTILANRYWRE